MDIEIPSSYGVIEIFIIRARKFRSEENTSIVSLKSRKSLAVLEEPGPERL